MLIEGQGALGQAHVGAEGGMQRAASATIRPELKLSTVAAAMTVGSVALLILALQPSLLGALVQAKVLTDKQLGLVATAEVLTIGLASGASPRLLSTGAFRLKIGALSLILAVVDHLTIFAHSAYAILAVRALAGLVEGGMLGATVLVILQGRRPERLNGVFLGVSAVPQAVGAFLLPTLILPRFGILGAVDLLAFTALISAGVSAFVSLPAKAAAQEDAPALVWSVSIAFALLAIFLQNAAIGAAWTYIERLAIDHGFSSSAIAAATAGNVGLQVVGALVMAWLGWRAPLRLSLVCGAVVEALIFLLLSGSRTDHAYVAEAWAFGLFWQAMSPIQLRLLMVLEPSRTAATWATALTLLGLALGPIAGSIGVAPGDVTGVFYIAVALLLISAALYATASWRVHAVAPSTGAATA